MLFPDFDGNPLAKTQVIDMIRHVAQRTGAALTEITENMGERHLFGGHAMRVTGAQMMSRAGIELYMIKLMGRWGSSAVERYVQDAPLRYQSKVASRIQQRTEALMDSEIPATLPFPLDAEVTGSAENSSSHRDEAQADGEVPPTMAYPTEVLTVAQFNEMVTALRSEIAHPFRNTAADTTGETFIENSATKYIHRMCRDELKGSSATWRTRGCGWKYGLQDYQRITTLPEQPLLCPQCFGFRRKRGTAAAPSAPPVAAKESESSESGESSSPDSDSSSSDS